MELTDENNWSGGPAAEATLVHHPTSVVDYFIVSDRYWRWMSPVTVNPRDNSRRRDSMYHTNSDHYLIGCAFQYMPLQHQHGKAYAEYSG